MDAATPEDASTVEVRVHAGDAPWSIETVDKPDGCVDPCILHVPRGKYKVTIGTTKDTILLDHPSAVALAPGSESLRTAGAITGLTGAALMIIAGSIAFG